MALNDQDQQADTSNSSPSPVGDLLRATRARVGGDLRDIATLLCIRYPYLLAIEEGRFQDLPGAAYATGFVRTYAEHLGLDGEEVIRRYRAETDGLRHKAMLAFPIPVSEERIPTGALVLVGVVLFVVAYGLWSWQSTSGRAVVEMIPELPAQLMALIKGPVRGAPDGGTVSAQDAGEVVSPSQAAENANGEETVAVSPDVQARPVPEVVMPPSSESDQSEDAEPPSPIIPPPAAVVVSAPATQVAPAHSIAAPGVPAPSIPVGKPPVEAVPTLAAVPLAEAVAVSPPASAHGEQGAATRVELRFIGDAWVQIRDEKTAVVTRLMRKGDIYKVPARQGLTMLAGNAGAITVLVDGVAAPSLGPKGMVRRNISLDPESLRAASPALDAPVHTP